VLSGVAAAVLSAAAAATPRQELAAADTNPDHHTARVPLHKQPEVLHVRCPAVRQKQVAHAVGPWRRQRLSGCAGCPLLVLLVAALDVRAADDSMCTLLSLLLQIVMLHVL
jgi:hypothetical protein